MAVSVVILVPVLGRPDNVAPLLASVHGEHRVLFLTSPEDRPERRAIDAAGGEWLTVNFHPADGDYARKINYGYLHTDEEFVFTGADDLCFHDGWYEAAMAVAPGYGVIGTNDLANPRVMAGRHSTHSLVRRSYVATHGTVDHRDRVLCEEYPHEFVDDELIATARRRGQYVWAEKSHVEHMHPHFRAVATDALYDGFSDRMRRGRRVWERRRARFGI